MWFFERKGSSGFSKWSTAEEVTQGIDGTGYTAIVTGASSGIGKETARVLAFRGVHVVMGVRNTDSGKKVREAILEENPNAKIDVKELDLSSMACVRNFASEFNSLGLPLNILINNAGVFGSPFMLSQDKIELQFATNHLGHFLLTNLLLETMKNTARQNRKEGRIINVASAGHRFAFRGIHFDRINDKSRYNSMYAYGQSKLANILHTKELAKRLKNIERNITEIGNLFFSLHVTNQEEGVEITANSVHPGSVFDTNIARYYSFLNGFYVIAKYLVKNLAQGASTTCYVALNPQVKGVTGEYFSDCKIAKPSTLAQDDDLAKQLWDFSLSLTDPK